MPHSAPPLLLNRIRMRQVLLMLAIHEHGTLHAAAEHLGMTQSAASKMLHELEAAVGETLFDREGRGLRLNPAGQAMMNACRGLRGTMTLLSKELSELRQGSAEKIFIGSILVALPECLSDTLLRIKRIYPLLSVDVTIGTSDRLLEQLRDGVLDIVIGRLPRPGDPSYQECVFHPIGEEDVSIIASPRHPLVERAKQGRVSFAALLDYPWILQSKGSPSREVIDQECISHGLDMPACFVETSSLIYTATLLTRENMLAVAPGSIAAQYVESGWLSIVPYDFRHKLSPWGSIVRRDRHGSPAKDMLLEVLHSWGSAGTR
ncbi:MAG: LysR family transcriptional regulator [Candidatus Accumulibacter sp.]|jgi:DNA-binding transcriptional LysR family regulator|nr:LysR family transcriptional regulator [Accumulibacter sp.]